MKYPFRPASAFSQLIALLLLLVAATLSASGQESRATVKGDALQIYKQISAQSEVTGTLERGAVVRIDWSVTNDEGSWCGVSSISPAAKLGFVHCNGLERQGAVANAVLAGRPEVEQGSSGVKPPAQTAKEWALAASALLTEFNHERHDTLAGVTVTEQHKKCARTTLQNWWDIRSREDLLRSLEWLDKGGHRQEFATLGERVSQMPPEEVQKLSIILKPEMANRVLIAQRYYKPLGEQSLVGFDYARYISLSRWGYTAGYLSEDEAWQRILYAAHILQRSFSSWRELGENYLIGREFWSLAQTQKDGREMRATYARLLSNANSPWNLIPWTLGLD